jgi:cell division protein FtsW
VLTVLFLFAWLVIRAFGIGKEAAQNERYFSALLAQGIGVWIAAQAIINIGVNMGLLPTKGLTLPLLSFGGSGILANCIAIAVLLRVDYENRLIQKGLLV